MKRDGNHKKPDALQFRGIRPFSTCYEVLVRHARVEKKDEGGSKKHSADRDGCWNETWSIALGSDLDPRHEKREEGRGEHHSCCETQ